MKKQSLSNRKYKHNKTKKNIKIIKNIKKTYAIVQYDNRKLDKNMEILTKINKKYCSLYNYDHIFITKKYNMPPYWIKVKIVRDLLLTNKYKGILWLDTDAVINDFSISLDSIQLPNKSMYYSYEFAEFIIENKNNLKNEDKHHFTFNAGVWFVLNDKQGRNIMNDWMLLYNPNKWYWKKKIKKWWCDDCKWAGEDFEQGSFFETIIPKYKEYCYQYPYYFFQSFDINRIVTDQQSFVYHFYGDRKIKYLKNYLESKKITINSINK